MYSGFRNRRTDLGTIVQRQVGRLALRYVDGGAYVRTYVQAVCDRVLTQRREGVRIRMEFLITTATSTIATTIATTYQYDYECHYDQQATRTTTTIHYEYDDYHPLLHTYFLWPLRTYNCYYDFEKVCQRCGYMFCQNN